MDIDRLRSVGCLMFCLLSFLISEGQTKSDLMKLVKDGSLEVQFDAHQKLVGLYDIDHVDSALVSALELVRIATELNDLDRLAEAHKFLSIGFRSAGLYDEALESSYSAISYYEKSASRDQSAKIADIYHQMAWIFTFQEDYEKTVPYFHRAIQMRNSKSRLDSIGLANSFTALGSFYYIYVPNYDSSEYYFRKAIVFMERLQTKLEVRARAEMELANAYVFDRKFDEAKLLIAKVKGYPSDSVSQYIQAYFQYLDGLYLHQIGKYNEAIQLFDPVYEWIKSSGNQYSEIGLNALRQIVETAEKGGFYEKAYVYLDLLRKLERESIYKDRQRTTKALEIVNETKRKEQLIGIQQSEITFQNQVIWAALIGLSIILALALILFQSRKKIHSKNQKIEMLMRELHHRVKNNLQVISSLLGLQSMKLQDAAAKQAISEGKQRIKAMSLIHQKLYQQDEVSSLDINEYISALVNDLADSFDFKSKGEVKIDIPKISLNADTSLPLGLIINELVTNALKYAYTDIEKPMLELKLIQQGNKSFLLSIRDNGPGLPANFNLAKAESFGLKLVNILIKQLDASIACEFKDGLYYQINFQSVK